MIYQAMPSNGQYPYPNHSIPPEDKGMKWCMAYAKAAYFDWSHGMSKGVFAANAGEYDKLRAYAMGKQPVDQYKKNLGVDPLTDNTWLSVDWSIRPIVSGYRDKAIKRLMDNDYGIVATPIDMLAKTEVDEFYNMMKAKLAVRQMVIQQNPEMASHPLISMQGGEPLDMEELEMRVELGEQFNRSKDAELAIQLGFYENDYRSLRRGIYEDLFDYGVAGVKDWLGEDGKAKFRKVDPRNVITSVAKDGNFKDLVHAGEEIEVSLIELATLVDKDGNALFTEKELEEFAGSLSGKLNNPSQIGNSGNWLKPYDKFKCKVLDIEFFTYNEQVYKIAPDTNGNVEFRKAEFGRGKQSTKYTRKKIQYTYKCKWIVGTDKCYDFGMAYDQKRSPDLKKKAKTKLSYSFCAYNFFDMKAQGFMSRLRPYCDDYQETILKVQNFKNRAVPSGWWIDFDALESVAMNKGGKNMTPHELLQMFFDTGVLAGRSVEADGQPKPNNWKPVIPIENSVMNELQGFYNDMMGTIMQIERMTGYNDITSGNGNPKTLVPGYEMAQQSTNDALSPMAFAEESLSLALAENVLCRMQQGVKKGEVSGYAPALNSNTLRFIGVNPDISLRDYGIMLEKKTSDDQKAMLLQLMQPDIANGFLSTADVVLLANTHNVKQAQSIFSIRVKKAKEKMHQQKMQEIEANNQGQAQITQMAQEAAMQQTMMSMEHERMMKQMEIDGELNKEAMKLQAQVQIESMKLGVQQQMNSESNATKAHGFDVTAQAKVISQEIAHETKLDSTHMSNVGQLEKQALANKKPQSTSKK